MAKNVDASLVKREADGRWLGVLQVLAPEIAPAIARPGRRMTCPVHGTHAKDPKKGDGFRLFRDASKTGGGICNQCGGHHDGLALLCWLRGWEFWEAVEAVAGVLHLSGGIVGKVTPRVAPDPTPTNTMSDQDVRAGLNRVWKGSLPIEHPDALPARLYLARRGLDVGLAYGSTVLRYHPSLAYRDDDLNMIIGYFPAIVALVHDADGMPVTIHRTYITSDGHKALVAEPKKMMYVASDRLITGGALPLGRPLKGFLGVAEGIETAFSVTTVTGLPVWPALNAGLMETFTPPPGVTDIIIWADHDRSSRGIEAANTLKQRAWEMGLRARIYLPNMLEIPDDKKGIDWNDVLVQIGKDGFLEAVRTMLPSVQHQTRLKAIA